MLVCYNTNKHRTKPNRTELSIYSKIYIEQRKTDSRFSKREQEKQRNEERNRDKFKNKSTIRRCVAVCCVCFFAPLLEKINTIIIIIRTVLLVSSGVRRRESTFEIQDSRFEIRGSILLPSAAIHDIHTLHTTCVLSGIQGAIRTECWVKFDAAHSWRVIRGREKEGIQKNWTETQTATSSMETPAHMFGKHL